MCLSSLVIELSSSLLHVCIYLRRVAWKLPSSMRDVRVAWKLPLYHHARFGAYIDPKESSSTWYLVLNASKLKTEVMFQRSQMISEQITDRRHMPIDTTI